MWYKLGKEIIKICIYLDWLLSTDNMNFWKTYEFDE